MTDYTIHTQVEAPRACGFRKPGPDGVGLYIMGPATLEPCERLPFPLDVCPCCGEGIRFSRSFRWVDPIKLFGSDIEPICRVHVQSHAHAFCPMCDPTAVFGPERAGLMWVGRSFYSPESFLQEAATHGISKKISGIPNGFTFGLHLILLAHIKACYGEPGIFAAFKPTHVDLVVDVDDAEQLPERAKHLKDKLGDHAHLIKVIRAEQQELT